MAEHRGPVGGVGQPVPEHQPGAVPARRRAAGDRPDVPVDHAALDRLRPATGQLGLGLLGGQLGQQAEAAQGGQRAQRPVLRQPRADHQPVRPGAGLQRPGQHPHHQLGGTGVLQAVRQAGDGAQRQGPEHRTRQVQLAVHEPAPAVGHVAQVQPRMPVVRAAGDHPQAVAAGGTATVPHHGVLHHDQGAGRAAGGEHPPGQRPALVLGPDVGRPVQAGAVLVILLRHRPPGGAVDRSRTVPVVAADPGRRPEQPPVTRPVTHGTRTPPPVH